MIELEEVRNEMARVKAICDSEEAGLRSARSLHKNRNKTVKQAVKVQQQDGERVK